MQTKRTKTSNKIAEKWGQVIVADVECAGAGWRLTERIQSAINEAVAAERERISKAVTMARLKPIGQNKNITMTLMSQFVDVDKVYAAIDRGGEDERD